MKKGFVAMTLALVAVVAFSGRAFAWGVDTSAIQQGIQDQIDAAADAVEALQGGGFHAISVVGPFEIGPVLKKSVVFSTATKDYSVVLHIDGDYADVMLYGKLADGVTEDDLSTFGKVGESKLSNQDLKDNFDAIKDKSMLVWDSVTMSSPDNSIPPTVTPEIESVCEVLSDGVHFRCSGFMRWKHEGKSIAELIDVLKSASNHPPTKFVAAANQLGAASPSLVIKSVVVTTEDADADGVPDALDGCPTADSFADPLAECETPDTPVDTDADGVADVDDPCPSDPTDACLQPEDSDGDGVADVDDACPSDPEDACVNANAGAGDTTPVGPVADDGGSCSLNPAAGGNPIAFLVIAFGLLPLAWRRKV